MSPEFFVIGAQKAGSTYLLRCLGEHPEIFMPPYEFAYFEDPIFSNMAYSDFEKHFEGAREDQVVGAKRPNLLAHRECPPRLREVSPGLKIVVILRHPIERAVSAYFHYMKTGFLPIVPIETGFRQLLDGEHDHLPRANDILEFGLYAKHLAHYAEYFPREKFHIILLDDIKRDARRELARVYEFLDVKGDYQPNSVDSKPMAATYSLTRLRLWNLIDQFCRSYRWDGFHRRRDFVSSAFYGLNRLVDRHLWARCFPAQRPELSDSLQQHLAEYYREDIGQLEQWLGRPLPGWADAR